MKIETSDNRMRVRVSELDKVINRALKLGNPLLLEGLSGIGKTEVAKKVVEQWLAGNPEWAGKFFQLQAFEYSDFTGIPLQKKDTQGDFIEFIQTQLTRIAQPTVILLDDITQASLDVQRVLLGLTQTNKVVGFTQINHPVIVIGTANDNSLDDKAMVNEMQSALETRWSGGRVVVEAYKSDLIAHFQKVYGADNLFTRYLASANCTINEDFECDHELKIRPVPRIIEGAVKGVQSCDANNTNELRETVAQIAGRKVASEFFEYLLSVRQLDPKEFFKKGSKAITDFAKVKNAETVQCIVTACTGLKPLLLSASEKQCDLAYSYVAMLEKAGQGEASRVLNTVLVESYMARGSDGEGLHKFMQNNPKLIAAVIEKMAAE